MLVKETGVKMENLRYKFRAYDEQQKIMHLDFEFISSGQEHNDWIIFKSDKQQLKNKVVFDNPYFYKQFKIMQYTGLKDKNSVEIYEGDILKLELDWGYGLAEIIIEVCFKDGSFRAKALNSSEDTLIIDLPYLEVIGNIYEHSHLLDND